MRFDTCLTLSYNPRLVVKVCFYLTICETAVFAVNYRSKGGVGKPGETYGVSGEAAAREATHERNRAAHKRVSNI